jgi:hypothetical protein
VSFTTEVLPTGSLCSASISPPMLTGCVRYQGLSFVSTSLQLASLHVCSFFFLSLNIMMDARSMYPDGWHPVETTRCPGDKFHVKARHFSRTQRPPKYYIIDFGISGSYDRRFPVRDITVRGGDKSCPEHRGNATHTDPFPTDVYYIGNVIKELFVEVSHLNRLSSSF